MDKKLSYDELVELSKTRRLSLPVDTPIFLEAKEAGYPFVVNTNNIPATVDILVPDTSISDNVLGYLICVHDGWTSIYVAREYQGNILDGASVCDLSRDDNLMTAIAKAKASINVCPVCGKEVPYKDQRGYSFAGRCCQECLPKMKRKYEQPGWYN